MGKRSITVIGGGVAGLTAAWRLQQKGFSVTVLEAGAQVGGRMGEIHTGNILYNTGARLVYPFGKDFNKLIHDTGLKNALVPVRNLSATCEDEQGEYLLHLMPGIGSLFARQLTWGDRLRLIGYAMRLFTRRGRLSPDDMTSALREDDILLSDHVKKQLGPRFYNAFIDPLFRGTRSWNSEGISASFFTSTLAHMLGEDTVYVFKNGMGQLPHLLAADLHVKLNCKVEKLCRQASGGCEIEFEENGQLSRLTSDYVLVATEGNQVLKFLDTPEPEETHFFSKVRYNSLGVVHYAIRGEIQPAMRFIPREAGSKLATYQQLPASPESNRPVAQLYCQLTPEAVYKALAMDITDDLDNFIRNDVRHLFPAIDERCQRALTQWIPNKLPIPAPGYGKAIHKFLNWQQEGPRSIYYCGDYLSQALVTGAVHSGTSVASLISSHYSSSLSS